MLLENISNLSGLLDFVTVVIGIAIAGYGLKVKFLAAAEKKAAEAEAKADELRKDHEALKKEFYDYRLKRAERRHESDRDWDNDQDPTP